MEKLKKTPLIRLEKLEQELKTTNHIYLKLGGFNPTGSIKDVTVFNMLNDYQMKGILKPGGVVIEATSGNTGISLSYFSKIFHYKAIIVMPSSMSEQRRNMIRQYGAELVLVEGGMKECNEKAEELLKEYPHSFIFDQFNNPANVEAHYKYTGKEIFEDLPSATYIFGGIGTGGTISGVGKFFNEHCYDTKIIGIEPAESPLITRGIAGKHLIQGIGANFIPRNYKQEYVDQVVTIPSQIAIAFARKIRDTYNIDVGYSSGAAIATAIGYMTGLFLKDEDIVIICPDRGDRYSW